MTNLISRAQALLAYQINKNKKNIVVAFEKTDNIEEEIKKLIDKHGQNIDICVIEV